ncbi:MAG: hypothetical protein AB8G05_26395 [Oligoflexales bacterium]
MLVCASDRKVFITLVFFSLIARSSVCSAISSLDQSLIPDPERKLNILSKHEIREHLIDRSFDRPSKCPLRANLDLWGLHSRLSIIADSLKYGECYNRNKNTVESFEKLLANKNGFFPSYNLSQENNPANETINDNPAEPVNGPNEVEAGGGNFPQADPTGDQSYTQSMQQQQIFTVLKTVAHDEACLFNVKQRGLLPVVADVATNVGQVASLMPTPNGFLLGAGGISIGSTLQIIIGLFKSPFDWKEANERKQFLDLNCSFFDLRRDVEAAEIIDIRDESIDEKIANAQIAQERLLDFLNQLKEEQERFTAHFKGLKLSHVTNALGQDHLDLVSSIDRVKYHYPNSPPVDEATQLKLIQEFTYEFPKIKFLAQQKIDNPPYIDYIYELLEQFQWSDLNQHVEMNKQDFSHKYAHPLFHYLNEYRNHLMVAIDVENQVFLDYKILPNEMSNQEILDEAQTNFDEITFKIADALSRIDTRIKILQSKDRKNSFDAYDEGAHATYDIIEEYRYIQSILTGKLGYFYMKFFRNRLKSENKHFQKNYRKFKKKYPHQNKPIRDLELPWACRDANQLRIIWEDANSSAEVSNDFIDTNIGLFHTNVKKIRTFLKFIPVDVSRELKLLHSIKSAQLAKNVLSGKELYQEKDMKKYGFIRSHNLGELMFDLRNSEHQREEIEQFWNKHNCLSYL